MFEVNKYSCKKFIDSPAMGESCSSARLDLRCSSEQVASATLSWMKSQLMFEVNISSSELAASAALSWMKSQLVFEVNTSSSELEAKCLRLDEVPTHVRSEHQLK